VERVEEPMVFGFTWQIEELPEEDPRRTYVEFTLEAAGAGTRLTVVETGFAQLPEDAYRKVYDGHSEGWGRELGEMAGYLDARGDMPRARLTFSMDGLAAMFGAFVGTSTTTAYVESASGIEEGGKTGITASTVGLLFVLSTFLWPIAGAVPGAATAPALILVGALMMQAAKDIDWVDLSEGVPAFLTVILMPLTFSIANGVSFGVIAYCAIKLLSGEGKKVSPILYVVALLLIARYVFLAGG